MERINIPRYINSQVQVFWWEIDEIIPLFTVIGLGIMSGALTYMLPVGLYVTWQFGRYKKSHLDGALLHIAFWHGVISLNKKYKNGLVRELVN
jgi:conjugal transfer pilus assembly protein TraL